MIQSGQGDCDVQVLLATYNGAKFLHEFLVSLHNQNGVRIHLIVSDDGSEDETLKIIESFRTSFHRLTILDGPRKGAASNFFYLLDYADADYVALADQDDIWNPNHLIDSIGYLTPNSNEPKMIYSSVLEFSKEMPNPKKWPKGNHHNFESFFFQNYARGCTIVLNRNLVELVVSRKKPEQIIMHDWWIALIAKSCGKAVFSSEPHIYYRLHADNTVGNRGIPKAAAIKQILTGNWSSYGQLAELFKIYGDDMKQFEKRKLEVILGILDQRILVRTVTVCTLKMRLRSKFFDELKVRLVLILYPAFSRN